MPDRAQARVLGERAATAAQRLRFLADASRILGESLDYQATLRTVANLAVPAIADWCIVDLLQDDGALARVAIAHRDPQRLSLVQDLQRNYPARPGAGVGPSHVARSGHTEHYAHVDDAILESLAPDPNHRRLLRELGLNSAVSVPLVAHGRILGSLSFFTEIGRVLTPDDRTMVEDLARRAATAIDNARLHEKAQRALRAREEMLAIVTHDLRTPLSAIITAAAMQMATAGQDAEGARVRRRAETIHRAAQHMSRLISDLSDIGRIDAGQLAVERAPHDIELIAREVIEIVHPQALERGCRIEVDATPGLPPILCDGDRVVQALSNLAINAVKVGSPTVLIRVGLNGDREVLFSVIDAGPGIPVEDLPHMFDRYWRARSSNYKGTGLGLAITHGIVTAHGGRIWAESEVGRGSRFFFTLPL